MALRQAEAGTPVAEICPKLHVTESPFYRWKEKLGGLGCQSFDSCGRKTGG